MTVSKDLIAGLTFSSIGVAVVIVAGDYPMGTLVRMGPGYFPMIIGSLTILIGLGLILKSLIEKPDPLPKFAFRQPLFLLGAIIIYAVTLERLGLVISTVLLIILSCLADRPVNWIRTLVLSGGLVALALCLFWYLLELPLDVWPRP